MIYILKDRCGEIRGVAQHYEKRWLIDTFHGVMRTLANLYPNGWTDESFQPAKVEAALELPKGSVKQTDDAADVIMAHMRHHSTVFAKHEEILIDEVPNA